MEPTCLFSQVRASAVYALGTFIFNGSERSDHANSIELGVGMSLVQCAADGSPLVRKVRSCYLTFPPNFTTKKWYFSVPQTIDTFLRVLFFFSSRDIFWGNAADRMSELKESTKHMHLNVSLFL